MADKIFRINGRQDFQDGAGKMPALRMSRFNLADSGLNHLFTVLRL
jgi:hypothetical protein